MHIIPDQQMQLSICNKIQLSDYAISSTFLELGKWGDLGSWEVEGTQKWEEKVYFYSYVWHNYKNTLLICPSVSAPLIQRIKDNWMPWPLCFLGTQGILANDSYLWILRWPLVFLPLPQGYFVQGYSPKWEWEGRFLFYYVSRLVSDLG
jgi:hypothetical protein